MPISFDAATERYMREIASIPRIDAQREQELSKIIQDNAHSESVEAAIQELVNSNLLLVIHCVKRFFGFLRQPDARTSFMDLVAEGNVALIKAARGFDASHGQRDTPLRFSSYAYKVIERRIGRAVKQSRFIHIPEGHFAKWSHVKALESQPDGEISQRALSWELGISTSMLGCVKTSMNTRTSSLEDLQTCDEGLHWSERMPDLNAVCTPSLVSSRDMLAYLETALEALPIRTRRMLQMRYFQEAPLEDLSQEFGVSRERCRQVCHQGLDQLRRQFVSCMKKMGVDAPEVSSPSGQTKKPPKSEARRAGTRWSVQPSLAATLTERVNAA